MARDRERMDWDWFAVLAVARWGVFALRAVLEGRVTSDRVAVMPVRFGGLDRVGARRAVVRAACTDGLFRSDSERCLAISWRCTTLRGGVAVWSGSFGR